jgi:CubicO group peptidase (beta-lactamase class C family)
MSRLMRVLICVLSAVVLFGALPVRAQQIDFSQVDSYISRLMALYDVPGAGIALVQDGQIVYAKGYGQRDVSTQAPATKDTVFEIGSVTKPFTALDVAQLVDAGKIDLDAPIVKYLPDFKFSDPAATQQITVRQVLSMSSGLPRADQDWYGKINTTRQQVINDIASIPLTDKPGKLWQYSNHNFVLAGYLVEKISGQSWEDYTRQHIFEPLGMKTAGFAESDMKKQPDHALPHGLTILSGQQVIPFFEHLEVVGPAGSIAASALDLAQFVRFQLGDGSIGGKRIVSEAMLKEMHHQHIALTTGPDAELIPRLTVTTDHGYGLGWFTEKYRGYDLVQHDGVINGFMGGITLVPSARVGVVVLTNTSGVNLFVEAVRLRLIEILLGLKPEQDIADVLNTRMRESKDNPLFHFLDPVSRKAEWDKARAYKSDLAELDKLTGDYTIPGGKITAVVRDGRLHLQMNGRADQDLELVQYEPNGFLSNAPLSAGAHYNFKIDQNGTITLFIEGQQYAQKLGKDVKVVDYTDPKGRFMFTVPEGLVAQPAGDMAVIPSTDPAGAFFAGATKAVEGDLKTNVTALLKKLDPSFNIEPNDVRPVPVNDLEWAQYLYQLPQNQVLAVVATMQKGTLYFVGVQGKDAAAVQALTPKFNALLLSYKITG